MKKVLDGMVKNAYQDILVEQELIKVLQEAEEDVKNNRVKSVKDTFIDIRNKLSL